MKIFKTETLDYFVEGFLVYIRISSDNRENDFGYFKDVLYQI